MTLDWIGLFTATPAREWPYGQTAGFRAARKITHSKSNAPSCPQGQVAVSFAAY